MMIPKSALSTGIISARGQYKASKGTAMGMVSPDPSAMSTSSPTLLHSKHCTSMPSASPRHPLRPILNGSIHLPSPLPPSNLSGKNLVGSSHTCASLCIMCTLTSIMCTLTCATEQAAEDSCGPRSGATGCSRRVSVMTHWR